MHSSAQIYKLQVKFYEVNASERLEALPAATVKITALLEVIQCNFEYGCRHIIGIYCP
jgi:hypothetical protein